MMMMESPLVGECRRAGQARKGKNDSIVNNITINRSFAIRHAMTTPGGALSNEHVPQTHQWPYRRDASDGCFFFEGEE